jgi:glycine/D-amino acid oxidase-like deaminating enzyme
LKLHDRVKSDDTLPERAGAVVIGAGVIGISTALELSERGVDVVVVEKGEVAAEQSSRNWGWCRQMGRDPREIPLVLESLKLWRGMNKRVGGETGWRQCGIMYLSQTEEEFAAKEAWYRDHAVPHQLATRMLASHEIAQYVPGSSRPWAGAMYTSEDGRAEPFIAVPAMARALQRRGGKVFTQCAARGIETSGGRVSSVVSERGVIKTDTVVLAGGYWSKRFLNNLGIRFPQLGVINSVMRTAPIDVGFERTVSGAGFAARKRIDGGFTIAHNHLSVAEITLASFEHFFDFLPALRLDWKGIKLKVGQRLFDDMRVKRHWKLDEVSPFEQVRILDPEPVRSIQDDAERQLKMYFPAFGSMDIIERWGGMIDATPDAVPAIDRIDSVPGLHLASGFSGHGFGLGPGAGKLMAEIVCGEKPCVDPAPFRYSRFIDGTKLQPLTGL